MTDIKEHTPKFADGDTSPARATLALGGQAPQDSALVLRRGIWPRSLPLWLAAFYVALFIIRPWDMLFPWMATIHFERLYFIGMLLVVAFSGERQAFRLNPQGAVVALFLASIGFAGLLAVDPVLAWPPFYTYTTLVLFYFVLVLVIRTPYELTFMVTCYIVTMAAYLAKANWEHFVHGATRYTMGVNRLIGIEGLYGGPNALAGSIVLSLPFVLFLWRCRQGFSSSWPPFWQRWFPRLLVFYGVLGIISIMLTNSRSGMVSLAFWLLLLGLVRGRDIPRKFGYLLLGVLVLLLLWVALPLEQKDRLRTIWNPESGPASAAASVQGRVLGYRAGMAMFKNFPISGVGPGNFIPYREKHIDEIPQQAHSLYGQALGETGIFGVLAFCAMVSVTLVNLRRVRRWAYARDDPVRVTLFELSLAGRDGILLLFFSGLFGHNLLRFNWLWIAAFAGLAYEFVKRESASSADRKGIP